MPSFHTEAQKSSTGKGPSSQPSRLNADRPPARSSEVDSLQRSMGNQGLMEYMTGLSTSSGSAPWIQRKCAACQAGLSDSEEPLHLQRQASGAARAEEQASVDIQPKLHIGPVNDPYEQEADRVADLVVGQPSQPHSGVAYHGAQIPDVQREAEEGDDKCELEPDEFAPQEGEEEPTPQLKSDTNKPAKHRGGIEKNILQLKNSGQPLPTHVRHHMEPKFGYDFSSVRIHTGHQANSLNDRLNAQAFTTGKHIFFSHGRFKPGTTSGDRLLAHELTHVLQQTGGQTRVQTKSNTMDSFIHIQRAEEDIDLENKPYYSSALFGRAVHSKVEKRLRGEDSELVTEAPIPGATRKNSSKLNQVGFADLYKSTPASTVAGVQAYKVTKDDGSEELRFRNMPRSLRFRYARTQPRGTQKGPDRTRSGGGWTYTGDFPSTVWLGEIKPLRTPQIVAGVNQLGHYSSGMQKFVSAVHTDSGGTTRSSIATNRLKLKIPDDMHYKNFTTSKTGGLIVKNERVWIYPVKGEGVYAYFNLSKDYDQATYNAWIAGQETKIKQVVKDLKKKPATVSSSLKAEPARPAIANSPSRMQRNGVVVQRKGKGGRPKTDWKGARKTWETKWRAWAKPVRSYLRKQGKALKQKVDVDEKLGLTGGPGLTTKAHKTFESINMWSGPVGKLLGKVRFLLGGAFDKVSDVFQNMREKLGGVKKKIGGLSGKSFGFGWRKTLIKVLMKGARLAATKLLTASFRILADCFNGLMQKAIGQFKEDMSEKMADELCELKKRYEDFKEKIDNEVGGLVSKFEELYNEISSAKKWIEIATGLISLIRLGVQAISCLSPPALGCLWGLVAQVGISVALDLIMGTQWFEDNIANPTVQKIIKRYAGKHYQNLIDATLGKAGLTEFASDVDQCKVVDEADLGGVSWFSGGLSGSALIKKRDAWNSKYKLALIQELQKYFEDGKGKPASPKEIQAMLNALDGLTPEQIKAVLAKAKKSGKKYDSVKVQTSGIIKQLDVAAEEAMKELGLETPAAEEPVDKPAGGPAGGDKVSPSKGAEGGGKAGGPGKIPGLPKQEGEEGEARPSYRAEAVPPGLENGTPTTYSWRPVWIMNPKGSYNDGDELKLIIDLFSGDQMFTVYDVVAIYKGKRISKSRSGTKTEYRIYFKNDWSVPAQKIVIYGGEKYAVWMPLPE